MPDLPLLTPEQADELLSKNLITPEQHALFAKSDTPPPVPPGPTTQDMGWNRPDVANMYDTLPQGLDGDFANYMNGTPGDVSYDPRAAIPAQLAQPIPLATGKPDVQPIPLTGDLKLQNVADPDPELVKRLNGLDAAEREKLGLNGGMTKAPPSVGSDAGAPPPAKDAGAPKGDAGAPKDAGKSSSFGGGKPGTGGTTTSWDDNNSAALDALSKNPDKQVLFKSIEFFRSKGWPIPQRLKDEAMQWYANQVSGTPAPYGLPDGMPAPDATAKGTPAPYGLPKPGIPDGKVDVGMITAANQGNNQEEYYPPGVAASPHSVSFYNQRTGEPIEMPDALELPDNRDPRIKAMEKRAPIEQKRIEIYKEKAEQDQLQADLDDITMRQAARDAKARQAEDDKINAQEQEDIKNYVAQRKQAVEDYGKNKVDPEQFWTDKSAAQLFAAGLGLALASMFGKGEQAIGMINKAIDRNIASQEANIKIKGNKLEMQQGVLRDMIQQGHDAATARQAAKVAILENAKLDMQTRAASFKSDQVRLAAEDGLANFELNLNKEKEALELALQNEGIARAAAAASQRAAQSRHAQDMLLKIRELNIKEKEVNRKAYEQVEQESRDTIQANKTADALASLYGEAGKQTLGPVVGRLYNMGSTETGGIEALGERNRALRTINSTIMGAIKAQYPGGLSSEAELKKFFEPYEVRIEDTPDVVERKMNDAQNAIKMFVKNPTLYAREQVNKVRTAPAKK